MDDGIFAAWFAEAERWFLFGNDDGVERSLGVTALALALLVD